ncbi:uncharacterized protein [Centruroides vittatus]|uniref:uncharacterized protein n=1 Tax=Centruroides vittatus TaxID=120091 RepID=UPI0035108DB9
MSLLKRKIRVLSKAKRALILLALAETLETVEIRKKRSCWVKSWFNEKQRENQSCYIQLMNELRLSNAESYRGDVRMDIDTFQSILSKIEPDIMKQYTNMRSPISAGERLSLTLRYLATGEKYHVLKAQYGIAVSTLSGIVREVMDAIYNAYHSEYMKIPTTENEWIQIASEFESTWQFPHCVGAVGGRHVRVKYPEEAASALPNYKGFYGIVTMVIVRADLSFVFVDVGTYARQRDSMVWGATTLKTFIESGELNIPPNAALENGEYSLPYVFIAGEEIEMTSCILQPYSYRQVTAQKQLFNFRLSRARNVVENAFGLLANAWRVLNNTILFPPDKVKKIILTCCILHNILIRRKVACYLKCIKFNRKTETQPFLYYKRDQNAKIPTRDIELIRDKFTKYFNRTK